MTAERATTTALPAVGLDREQVFDRLGALQKDDLDWRAGKHQGWVYWAGDDVIDVAIEAMRRFYYSNPLLPRAFPSLGRLSGDLVAAAAELLHAPAPHGLFTSGGTESNLLAIWTALQFARQQRGEGAFNIIVPYSAHPSFDKGAGYFGLDVIRVPTTDGHIADVEATARAVDSGTILLVGSAPGYAHGLVDPIDRLGELALSTHVPLHVDSCVGGFMLPFVERLGRHVPSWDFRVPGVTSISADIHKHGYGPKGTSLLLTDSAAYSELAAFRFENWPHGPYATPAIAGSRSGSAIAGAWAVFQYLGESGLTGLARRVMGVTDAFMDGIAAIDGLAIVGSPPMNKFAVTSEDYDIMVVADQMEDKGWVITRQADPEAIGMHAATFHEGVVDRYLTDLTSSAAVARSGRLTRGDTASSYN